MQVASAPKLTFAGFRHEGEERPCKEKKEEPTLHVVCSLIPEIHFTVGPTRNAISAILLLLNSCHWIILQELLVVLPEDSRDFWSQKLYHWSSPYSPLAHIFLGKQPSCLCHKIACHVAKMSEHGDVLISNCAEWKDVDRVPGVLQLETCTSDWPPALVRCHASPLPKCPKRQHLPASEHVEPVRHKISRYRRQIKNKTRKKYAIWKWN